MLNNQTSISKPVYLRYIELDMESSSQEKARIVIIVLNRPKHANALNSELIYNLQEELENIKKDLSIRAVVFQGAGMHFCAGADLDMMKSSADLQISENLQSASALKRIFDTIYHLEMPTIAVVRGISYGGGVGFIACCDFAISTQTARFCFTEARMGLLPAVILPYLIWKLPTGQRNLLVMCSKTFNAQEAYNFGLIQIISEASSIEMILQQELNRLLMCSPNAHKELKKLERILYTKEDMGELTAQALAQSRSSEEGLAGLKAHFLKHSPPWVCRIPNETRIIVD